MDHHVTNLVLSSQSDVYDMHAAAAEPGKILFCYSNSSSVVAIGPVLIDWPVVPTNLWSGTHAFTVAAGPYY